MPNIGTSKNILASRLKALVELGIFEIRAGSDGSASKEYVLTDKGRSVFPVVVAMRQWGEKHLFEGGETHSVLLDNENDQPVMMLDVRAASGKRLEPQDCHRRRVTRPE